MKKILSLVLVLALCFGMVSVLASCAPSGKYEATIGTYEFKGSKYTYTASVGAVSVTTEGTFKMGKDDDGNKTIIMTAKDSDKSVTYTFVSGKDDNGAYVKIAGVSYYKK